VRIKANTIVTKTFEKDSVPHRPRKRFGQHFLKDLNVVQHMVAAVNPQHDDSIVEIGPGLGALTQALLPHVKHMHAVELDRDIVPKLQKKTLPLGNLTIHGADALQFNFCSLQEPQQKLRIVGNLPYNISTPLLFALIAQAHCIKDMHFMLQKEVVDRLAALPDSSNYGRLSVIIQYHCHVEKLFNVPPDAFSPPPKVDSAVVRLVPYAQTPVVVDNLERFEQLVGQAFSQRRKTLRNNLKGLVTDAQFAAVSIDPQRRAETLSLHEFAALANILVNEE
jgi:16S rRNA (adenine1518-N6/adenine1519-N6)-dimethyltransferase